MSSTGAWPMVALGEVATIDRLTVAPNAISDGTRYVGLEHIQGGGARLDHEIVRTGDIASNKFVFTGSHILYGKLRPYLAKIVAPSFDGVCSTDILPVRPSERIDRGFLLHFLRQPDQVERATSRATGANLPRLAPRELASFPIPLPPLTEQRQIAKVLDRADALRRRRREVLALLDTLPAALFAEMFGNLMRSTSWERHSLRRWIADFESGKNLAPDPDNSRPDAVRVLKVSAVTTGVFKEDEAKPLPVSYVPPASHIVRSGDLLFSRANTAELIGATAYVDAVASTVALPDKLWRFRWTNNEAPNPHFICALFASAPFRYELSRRATGTSGSMKNISKAKVLDLKVAQPSRFEQDRFAEKLAWIRRTRARTANHQAHLDTLFVTLQSRAFAGEL